MSEKTTQLLQDLLTATRMEEVKSWLAKYPSDQKQSAVMAVLRIAQEQYGHLTPQIMDAVAVYLEMAPIAVYEVATFYTMYELSPVGRHIVNVCTNISCKLRGADQLLADMEKMLGIPVGQTTADGRFTLRFVECLGACVTAPVMQVDKDYHENLTLEKVEKILEQYP